MKKTILWPLFIIITMSLAHAAPGDPTCYGNGTIATTCLGGQYGNINTSGNITGKNLFANISWTYVTDRPAFLTSDDNTTIRVTNLESSNTSMNTRVTNMENSNTTQNTLINARLQNTSINQTDIMPTSNYWGINYTTITGKYSTIALINTLFSTYMNTTLFQASNTSTNTRVTNLENSNTSMNTRTTNLENSNITITTNVGTRLLNSSLNQTDIMPTSNYWGLNYTTITTKYYPISTIQTLLSTYLNITLFQSSNTSMNTRVTNLESSNTSVSNNAGTRLLNSSINQTDIMPTSNYWGLNYTTLNAKYYNISSIQTFFSTYLNITLFQSSNTSMNTRVTNLESSNTSMNTRVTNLESSNTSMNTRVTNMENSNTTQGTFITNLLVSNSSINNRTTNLETSNTTQATAIANMVSSNTTIDTRLGKLETSNTTQATAISNLNVTKVAYQGVTGNVNMSSYNVTDVKCIKFIDGGQICSTP